MALLMKSAMPPRTLPSGFIAPCLPTNAPTPSGREWVHEIKFDGFRVIARKNHKRVKLYSRPGGACQAALAEPMQGDRMDTQHIQDSHR